MDYFAMPSYRALSPTATTHTIWNIALITIVVASFYMILFYNPYIIAYSFKKQSFIPHILIIFGAATVCLRNMLSTKRRESITKIDLAICSWILSALISRFAVARFEPLFNESTANLLIVGCLYFIVRNISADINIRFWSWALAPALLLQVSLVCSKFIANYGSGQSYMLLKGTLGNSGICAGFVAITAPLALELVKNRRVLKYLTIFIVVMLLLMLRSRASLLAFVPVFLLYTAGDDGWSIKKIASNKFFKTTALVLVPILSIFLFLYRKDSALGRMAIWKLCVINIPGNAFLGNGYGEFPETYKRWQSTYFQTGKATSAELSMADLPAFTFNEPLQILVEQGFLGLATFLCILATVWLNHGHATKDRNHIRICLLSALVFSFFSYPLHSFPILALVFILLGLVKGQPVLQKRQALGFRLAYLPVLGILLYILPYFLDKRRMLWEAAKRSANSKDLTAVYGPLVSHFDTDSDFLVQYAKCLYNGGQFSRCIEILKKAERQAQSIEINLLMGRCFQALGQLDRARAQFSFSMRTLPNRLTPRYELFQLYVQKKDTLKAIEMGNSIMSFPLKINTISGMRLKHRTAVVLNSLQR